MIAYKELPNAPKPVGPYSAAVVFNNTVYCAGQIGLDPLSGKVVEGGVEAETKQVLQNLKAVLEGVGSSVEKIAMTTIFLTDMADGALVNPIYAEFISKSHAPARQTIAVKALPMGVKIEISLIASL